ncbi:VPLPA-CTERM-specific exosortase XrtD [Mangrovimicrobium sediminis]|uniref:VPLPA-CTERM-specific exosortase XrtD n=2 Tax=Mangrovimicrobium sediminis TaxID=2562682 RepID=A0A4Z0M386_9GAMM|nr:VPLPA-CTERM-specific exosortase XrtD [Haliea sp. SAOS-164]
MTRMDSVGLRFVMSLALAVALAVLCRDAVAVWAERIGEPRYSHVPLVQLLALYLIWIRRAHFGPGNPGAWVGVALVAAASCVLLVGVVSAIWSLIQYGLVLVLIGFFWTLFGARARIVAIPLLLLFMTVPLPYMLDVLLSGRMQLLSSDLGARFLRGLGVTVFLEGNLIDLGFYKLQVVEACSGLNYMYPLIVIGLLMAFLYQAPLAARLMLLVSTIPISILMNSLRIAIVGVLVKYVDSEAADGFLHYFEGWVIFLSCVLLLLLEVKLFNTLRGVEGGVMRSLSALPAVPPLPAAQAGCRFNLAPALAATGIIAVMAVLCVIFVRSDEQPRPRVDFVLFPMHIDGWSGRRFPFANNEDEMLGLSDYLLAEYTRGDQALGLYIGYTASQRRGFEPHSPKACLPGAGWEISEMTLETLPMPGGGQLKVTRLLIAHGQEQQIVYYWFRQRGQDLSNEYAMKLALLRDSITRNRTDGAIVRLRMPVQGSVASSERDLVDFLEQMYPLLPQYVPD